GAAATARRRWAAPRVCRCEIVSCFLGTSSRPTRSHRRFAFVVPFGWRRPPWLWRSWWRQLKPIESPPTPWRHRAKRRADLSAARRRLASAPTDLHLGAMPDRPVFRFAPSPNGELHLGHALSALIGFERARAMGGRFLLRIEDIDAGRSRSQFVAGIF